jgi:flagellar transcriptional activator FlhD
LAEDGAVPLGHFFCRGRKVKAEQLKDEIRETNLAYLMLAQHMLREDRAQALFRLGISDEVAAVIESLTTAQLLKLAASSVLMCRFSFNESMVWSLLTSHSRDGAVPAGIHASILMAGQPALAAA